MTNIHLINKKGEDVCILVKESPEIIWDYIMGGSEYRDRINITLNPGKKDFIMLTNGSNRKVIIQKRFIYFIE